METKSFDNYAACRIEIVDRLGKSTRIIPNNVEFSVIMICTLDDSAGYISLETLRATVYFEQLGAGSYFEDTDEQPWIVGKKEYRFEIRVSSGKLQPGIYKPSGAVRGSVSGKTFFVSIAEASTVFQVYTVD